MALKVIVNVAPVRVEGPTIIIPTSVHVVGQTDFVLHEFSGLAANIPNAAAMTPYLKTQVIAYVQSFYSQTVVDTEIAVAGGPL